MRSQEELEAERQEDLKSLSKAEALGLLLLLRGAKKAFQQPSDLAQAEALRNSIFDAVRLTHDAAISESVKRTRAQLKSIGVKPGTGLRSISKALAEESELRASRAAHGITNRFITSKIEDGPKFNVDHEMGRSAASEAAELYNGARREQIKRLPPTVQKLLVKTWRSQGDKHVCLECAAMEGVTVPVTEDFPGGSAPKHAKCRCTEIISLAE